MRRRLGLWLCRVMDWHRPPTTQGFNGISFFGICPRCGVRVLMDSQGNWFSAVTKELVGTPVEPQEKTAVAKILRHEFSAACREKSEEDARVCEQRAKEWREAAVYELANGDPVAASVCDGKGNVLVAAAAAIRERAGAVDPINKEQP